MCIPSTDKVFNYSDMFLIACMCCIPVTKFKPVVKVYTTDAKTMLRLTV